MKKRTWSILTVAALCVVLFATACATTTTTTSTKTVTATITVPATTITSTVTTTLPPSTTTITNTSTVATTTAATTPPATGSSVGVSIVAGSFQPSTLAIKVGTAVVFTNNHGTAVNLISKSGFTGSFGTAMAVGTTYTYIFSSIGVYVVGMGEYNTLCTITVTN